MRLDRVDLLESGDEREVRPLGVRVRTAVAWRVPPAAVAGVALAVAGVLAAGAVAAMQVTQAQADEAARIDVALDSSGSSSSTIDGVARGELELRLVNRRQNVVRVSDLRVAVDGLRVLRTEPAVLEPLGPFEERLIGVVFAVPDCARLRLPGVLSVTLTGEGQPSERRELPVFDPRSEPPVGPGVPLAACPAAATAAARGAGTADLAARPAGGRARRIGLGAEGVLRLELRNGGQPVRLLSLDGEVPGARFRPVRLDGGRTIETDGVIIVRLPFTIDDCGALQPAGRLVLRVERFGATRDVGLRAVPEPEAGVGPQVDLRVLFSACD